METKFNISQKVYYAGYDKAHSMVIDTITIREKRIAYCEGDSRNYCEDELYETYEAAQLQVVEKKLRKSKAEEEKIQKEISKLEHQKKELMILILGDIK